MKKSLIAYLLFFTFLISTAIFSWGFATAKFRMAGYEKLSAAVLVLDALKVYLELEIFSDRPAHLIAVKTGFLESEKNSIVSPEGFYTLYSHFNGDRYQASLVDEKGKLLHEWQIPFEEAGLIRPWFQGGISQRNLTIHGVQLYSNGDLLMVIDYRVLIKVDKDSNLLWVNSENIHHAVTVDEHGGVWTFNRHLKYGDQIASHYQQGYYFDDQILALDDEGKKVKSWSITELISRNGYEGLLLSATANEYFWNSDPVHANDIDVLTETQAGAFPGAKAGDVLISLRSISTLMVVALDAKEGVGEIIWSMTGPFLRQHDPEVDEQGLLWVFDNRNAWPQENAGAVYTPEGQGLGGSRILAFEPATRALLWSSENNQEYTFFSSIMGRVQVLESGNLLVVEPEAGRIFELDRESNAMLWQHVNFMKGESESGFDVGRISDADQYRAEDLEFLSARD